MNLPPVQAQDEHPARREAREPVVHLPGGPRQATAVHAADQEPLVERALPASLADQPGQDQEVLDDVRAST